MDARLSLFSFSDSAGLEQHVLAELGRLAGRDPEYWSAKQNSLIACCAHGVGLGAVTAVIQRRLPDPDFLAEFNAYYSRLFAPVPRYCVRVHLFAMPAAAGQDVLGFLDGPRVAAAYLGFITLRPVIKTPVGASILRV